MKMLVRHSLGICVCLAVSACAQSLSFNSGPSSDAAKADPICVPGQKSVTLPTKFLFIVDMSGSNFDGPFEHPGEATDPLKTFRYGVINDFFGKHGSSPSVNWGFITFNGTAAQGYINSGDQQHPTFSNAPAMTSALQTFLQTKDVGDTPYKAALTMAHDLIQQDMATSGVSYQYRIAMLTDGYPTDYCPGGPTQLSCPGQIMDSALIGDLQNLMNLSPKSIEFSTVYYGLPDADAAARLQRMAIAGNGQFVDTNVSKVLNLDNVIQVPTSCP